MAYSTSQEERIAYFANAFSWMAFFSVTVFGVVHLFTGENIFLGYLEIAAGVVLLLNVLYLKVGGNVALARWFFLCALLAIYLILLVTGGTHSTGIFWFFLFPAASFFLTNRKQGVVWVFVLMLMVAGVKLLADLGVTQVAYPWIVLRQSLIALAVVTLAIYLYEDAREKAERNFFESQEALQKEKEILASEKRKDEAILESIGEGVVVVNNHGTVQLVNRAAEELLGWSAHELIDKEYVKAIPMLNEVGNIVHEEKRPLNTTLLAGKKVSITAEYIRKDKRKFSVGITGAPLIKHGKIAGAVFALRDVTEEKRLERSKTEFVTLASHQLRTPLTAISWFTEMLLHGDAGKLTSAQQEHILNINTSTSRMVTLIEELLTVSQIELGNFSIAPTLIDVAELCRSVIKEVMATSVTQKKLQIKTAFPAAFPMVSLDEKSMKIIVRHLVTNACKYTAIGGTVVVGLRVEGKKMVFTVEDSGIGIPKSQQAHIFTRFFRGENAKDIDTDGTGLGLFIVKSIVTLTGGSISFESTEQKGTHFTVTFPLKGMVKHSSAHSPLLL